MPSFIQFIQYMVPMQSFIHSFQYTVASVGNAHPLLQPLQVAWRPIWLHRPSGVQGQAAARLSNPSSLSRGTELLWLQGRQAGACLWGWYKPSS